MTRSKIFCDGCKKEAEGYYAPNSWVLLEARKIGKEDVESTEWHLCEKCFKVFKDKNFNE